MFPALEVARQAQEAGWEVRYFGSLRGIEGKSCEKAGVPFIGFSSEPLYRIYTPRGVRAAYRIAKARLKAKSALMEFAPHAMLSTGGYASAPVVIAARSIGIPYVIHEQNTVPGRTNQILGQNAFMVCTTFASSAKYFPENKCVNSGLPIRSELRASAQGSLPHTHPLQKASPIVLVMGGSQGSTAINDIALATAVRMTQVPAQWLHVTGTKHFEPTIASRNKMALNADYTIKAYLDAEQMSSALFSCSLAVCRSGAGTLAELAAFRKPSVLVPFPAAFRDHQRLNAEEFKSMGAADVILQRDLTASALERKIVDWLGDESRRERAAESLAQWDRPNAAMDILNVLEEAAK